MLSFFTPLEQFDQVVWLTHNVFETLQPYQLFISEIEFDANQLYINSYGIVSSSISFNLSEGVSIIGILVLVTIIFHYVPIISTIMHVFFQGFTPLFFLGTINLFTGFFIIIWFTDFFFITEEISTEIFLDISKISNFNHIFAPQIDISFSMDEIIITFIIAFFLIGNSETADEDDFLLSNESDLEIVEDVVAPLFVANLDKNIAENGALYLKVCAIFSFVLISNLIGIIPYGDTATSSLILTFWVSFSVFVALVALRIRKHGINYFFSLFIPSGCPLPLIFLLIPIEFLSYSFRLVSLAVRLFANIIAGHTLIKVLIGFSYVMFTLGDGYAIAAFLPALVVFILIFLEIAVAAIQAYIFTILTCIYLKDIYTTHLKLINN